MDKSIFEKYPQNYLSSQYLEQEGLLLHTDCVMHLICQSKPCQLVNKYTKYPI